VLPRLVAFGGAFSVTGLALFPQLAMQPAVAVASLLLLLAGYAFGCYAVGHLGRALSLTPEARHLVTSGPYRHIRHPLYAAEAVASVGLLLQVLCPGAIALWCIHMALQFCRLRREEAILGECFPAYAAYAARVPRLLPGLF
jgi:protein-S-isoprenylcysteine O-methyltransferase Ste14